MTNKKKRESEKKHASAEYIASMCDELVVLAERSGFQTGSYLLRMAGLEFKKQQDCSEDSARKTRSS